MTSILANNESNNGKEEMGKEALKKKREECLKKWRGSRKEKSRAEKKTGKTNTEKQRKNFPNKQSIFLCASNAKKITNKNCLI